MNIIINNGLRKNRYFDEEKFIEDITSMKGLSLNNESNKRELKEKEVYRIDQHIKKYKRFCLKNFEGIDGKIKGVGTIFHFIGGEEEEEIVYESSALREFYFIKPGSKLRLKSIFEGKINYTYREFFIGEHSEVEIVNYGQENNFIELISYYTINKESKFYEENKIIIKRGEGRVFTQLNHIKKSKGQSLSKAVLRNNSKLSLEGIINIESSGKDVDSYLNQHAILFEESSAYAFPALEIKNNEVKASHSASIKQINNEDLFYMESRGIKKEEAENMLIEGFLK